MTNQMLSSVWLWWNMFTFSCGGWKWKNRVSLIWIQTPCMHALVFSLLLLYVLIANPIPKIFICMRKYIQP